ncbi:MAG: hypothetical protein ACKVOJ_11700 [Sphingomonadaceae bacterium]
MKQTRKIPPRSPVHLDTGPSLRRGQAERAAASPGETMIVTGDAEAAFAEWLAHVEAGRIGVGRVA